jgi:hypothetical protein
VADHNQQRLAMTRNADATAQKAYDLARTGFWLRDGALVGDDLLAELTTLGFSVRLYDRQAALDDDRGQGAVPDIARIRRFADQQQKYSAALLALKAPDQLAALIAREGKAP